jgi:hypothetical protein
MLAITFSVPLLALQPDAPPDVDKVLSACYAEVCPARQLPGLGQVLDPAFFQLVLYRRIAICECQLSPVSMKK